MKFTSHRTICVGVRNHQKSLFSINKDMLKDLHTTQKMKIV